MSYYLTQTDPSDEWYVGFSIAIEFRCRVYVAYDALFDNLPSSAHNHAYDIRGHNNTCHIVVVHKNNQLQWQNRRKINDKKSTIKSILLPSYIAWVYITPKLLNHLLNPLIFNTSSFSTFSHSSKPLFPMWTVVFKCGCQLNLILLHYLDVVEASLSNLSLPWAAHRDEMG